MAVNVRSITNQTKFCQNAYLWGSTQVADVFDKREKNSFIYVCTSKCIYQHDNRATEKVIEMNKNLNLQKTLGLNQKFS